MPTRGSPTRPEALILGASLKVMVAGVIVPRTRHSLTRPLRPGLRRLLSASSPRRTSTRFSPTSGAMSATVAMVTRSRKYPGAVRQSPCRSQKFSASSRSSSAQTSL